MRFTWGLIGFSFAGRTQSRASDTSVRKNGLTVTETQTHTGDNTNTFREDILIIVGDSGCIISHKPSLVTINKAGIFHPFFSSLVRSLFCHVVSRVVALISGNMLTRTTQRSRDELKNRRHMKRVRKNLIN